MSDKPRKDKTTVDAETERDERPPRGQAGAAGRGQPKRNSRDAARKMRAMYKG